MRFILNIGEDGGTFMPQIKDYPPYLDYPKPRKKVTNADKIRSMKDEELAELLERCEGEGYQDSSITPVNEYGYHMDMLEWLGQPAEEEKE